VLGQVVTKVGRTTAETSGEVTATCADINPEYTLLNAAYPGNLTLLCQHRFAAESDRGDSGGPVFAPIGASLDVDLHGVLSGTELGGDQPGSWFSALGQIEVDLGNLLPEMSNQAPVVEIIAPADGAMIGSGSFVDVTFEASYFDFEDGYACTNCVSWYSSVDGPLGNSSVVQGVATLQVMLNGTGPRLITAWAWDGSAAADTDTISVHIGNMAPQVSILAPQDGAALVQGFTYVFQGDSFDPELFHALPCGSLTWTSSNPADAIHNHPGCALSASFATIGPRTITLTGVDADAVSAADTIAIDVVPPPSNAPPVVTILHPANNALLAPQTLIALTGKIQDPDGLSPIAYQWILTRGSTQTVLGTGQAQSGHNVMLFWTPASNVPFHCGGSAVTIHLVATDLGNDTGWDSVNATVHFPAC
jgi:hypothetical protein